MVHREVDWNLGVGAIFRRSYDLNAPSPLFQCIKNRVGQILGARVPVSKALGLEPTDSLTDPAGKPRRG
jgi:3-polyprenyl-4-hydroxybenzoate decarboxylase